MTQTWEAIVIGAGPAGLTAATYLARFRRRVLVLDGGPSRADWIPESHNTPGFSHGVSGPEFVLRLGEQAERFGVERRQGLAMEIVAADDGFQVIAARDHLQASAVLLATGVVDRLPPIAGLDAAIRSSVARMCPICDGYEAIGKRIAVLGSNPRALREAAFLRTYSDDVTVLQLAHDATESKPSAEQSVAASDLSFTANGVQAIVAGRLRSFDHLYLALGCAPQSELAARCGAAVDDAGALLVDAHQMTSVPGLYAAGDLVRGLSQIAVATGEAAIAATAVHNRLRGALEQPSP
jgi:thioredoxin reductase (NADPH)